MVLGTKDKAIRARMFRENLVNLNEAVDIKPNLKVLTAHLLLKNAVYLQNHGSCPFLLDTSCIWLQMRPWSILSCTASLHQKNANHDGTSNVAKIFFFFFFLFLF